MALLDVEKGVIVLRIVYDGPAMSGKTTTLRSLASSLGRDMFSADEAEGRTLFFDWVDYTGGRFNGHPIRCQLVGVPGQRALRSRRERILETADAVVFVADSRRTMLDADARMAASLEASLSRVDGPTPGVVIQANKRDDPDAASLAELRVAFDSAGRPMAIMESTATSGAGVRETFIFAVRLALDRVRELMQRGLLRQESTDVDSGEALLSALRRAEADRSGQPITAGPAAEAFAEALAAEEQPLSPPAPSVRTPRRPAGAPDEIAPELPTTGIPGGMIWPPVGGRVLLQSALSDPRSIARLESGAWAAMDDDWRLHSYGHDVFQSVEDSRAALVEWARLHAAWSGWLSGNRCIVSAPSGPGQWRLWQVVGVAQSLRAQVGQAIRAGKPDEIARALLQAAEALSEGRQRYSPLGLEVSLDNVGSGRSGIEFVGLAPGRQTGRSTEGCEPPSVEDLIRANIRPLVASARELDVPLVLSEISRHSGRSRVGELLSLILIGH